jgi:protein-tyrosine phosphatase
MVVVAYLMEHYRISRDDALEMVKEKRWQVQPNRSFMNLLARFYP